MKFEAVTIKDIAKALGLSTSTVSRALRDSYEISAETKRLVKEYATSINYRPNPIALSLKEKRSRSIGVIVCEIANSFFSQIINGIESIAYDQGYNVTISQSHESFQREVLDVSHMASRSIDGLLISVSAETQNFDHLKKLHAQGLPIVFFDRIVHDIKTHKVTSNNAAGAHAATIHLISNGYRRIANLAAADYMTISQERISGYRRALSEKGMPYDEALVKHCTHGGMLEQEVEVAMDQLLSLPQKPDAILASADKLTTSCLRYLHKRGLKVPDDIALVGFSNSDLTELLNPPLTIVKQPAFEIGRTATEMLLQQIESKRPIKQYEHKVLPAELFIRESSLRRKG